MNETKTSVFEPEIREKNQKLLLYLAIGSMIMMFTGLTSAYIVSMGRAAAWLEFDLPASFWFSTAVILSSSYTMHLAKSSLKNQDGQQVRRWMNITLILGVVFGILQFFGWQELVSNRIFFAGKQSNAAGSYVYVITGLHLLHLAGGLIYLSVARKRVTKNMNTAALSVKLCSTYWHFLDVLWLYLFFFLLFIG
jgi:cytochrome c oxidase subunit 3